MNRQAVSLCLTAAAIGVLATPSMALAHSAIPGIGFFYSGMLHPLRVAEHLLALLALALLLGQTGLQKSHFALGAFSAGLVLGLPVLIYVPEWAGRGIETLLLMLLQ